MITKTKMTEPMKVRDLLLSLADMDLELPVFIGDVQDREYVTELKAGTKLKVQDVDVDGKMVKAIVLDP